MISAQQQEEHLRAAIEALRRGDGEAARRALEPMIAEQPRAIAALFLMAQAGRLAGDADGEAGAIDRLLAVDPGHLGALLMKGAAAERDGRPADAAVSYRTAVRVAASVGAAPPASLAGELRRVEDWLSTHDRSQVGRLHALLESSGHGADRRSALVEETLAILTGEAPIQLQHPSVLYVPGLPQRAFYDRSEFPWIESIEQHTDAIRAECLQLLDDPTRNFEPYIGEEADRSHGTAPNAHLAGDRKWEACHLLTAGRPIADHAERCPATMAALGRVPLPRIVGRSPMALFSALQPGTHIRPHHGLFNFRLICHLPLIVPPGCELRVGNHRRGWSAGEMLIFDDSIEHEAWNRSGELRVVLIFEIWRPEIAERDREALTILLEASGGSLQD